MAPSSILERQPTEHSRERLAATYRMIASAFSSLHTEAWREVPFSSARPRAEIVGPDGKARVLSMLAARKAKWVRPEPRYKYGVLAKYAKLVTSASEGAVTDKNL